MSKAPPTLINLPPPPNEMQTPVDAPGTPNSTTTSMSELSMVAIKDGHRGHLPHHYQPLSSARNNQLDAERADRISRLAGMERVSTTRSMTPSSLTPGAVAPPQPAQSYFDSSGNPAIIRERSTVGSASATGSVGGRTTWAGSEVGDADKMSESQDMELDGSSVGGMSEDQGSLVGFGEGARTPARQPVVKATTPTARDVKHDTHMIDANDYTARKRDISSRGGAEQAERIVNEHMDTSGDERMRGGNAQQADLGKFGFEQ
ncbi:hypothetical protein K470DRAFT_243790 [Piedraia hortae CBS 480.64]|uniref:Uncharacterized protein n=1 Tax=Piedraia hortae CBS 480.64 TaxID=1314780 RepID=A0A6A7C4K8_9PEZI|nr:hypothetical protein K470DRAFT_243790 [Piedraia hortae CBS 480.64]